MGKIHKLPALPEGVLDHSEFQQPFWAVQRISWMVLGYCNIPDATGIQARKPVWCFLLNMQSS